MLKRVNIEFTHNFYQAYSIRCKPICRELGMPQTAFDPAIPTDRILTETDSPYLAPVPYRGKRNESSYIPLIVATIADSLGKSPAEVGLITTANAKTLFAL